MMNLEKEVPLRLRRAGFDGKPACLEVTAIEVQALKKKEEDEYRYADPE